jgi:hypothetical protein
MQQRKAKRARGRKGNKTPAPAVEQLDHVAEYSKGLLFAGLHYRVLKAAIRAGDGNVMRQHWKIDLLTMYARKHHNFFLLPTIF